MFQNPFKSTAFLYVMMAKKKFSHLNNMRFYTSRKRVLKHFFISGKNN